MGNMNTYFDFVGYVKEITNSDVMVVHVLTAAYLLCAIPWIIELIMERVTRKTEQPR